MKKLLFISIFFLVINFTFAQVVTVDENLFKQVENILQKLIQREQVQFSTSSVQFTIPTQTPTLPIDVQISSVKTLEPETEKKIETPILTEIKVIQPKKIELPKTIKPALPQDIETKPITPEIIKTILPDEDKNNDVIIQINNLKITRILLDPGIENVKAIFFAVRDIGWKCMLFELEESERSLPCPLDVRKPISQKELVIQISNDTILLQRNRQKAKLEDFKVGDKINVYGFMDKDSNGIEVLIVRKVASVPKPIFKPTPKPIETKLPATSTPRVCIQVITPAYNPQNPLECKEFSTPCDVPYGWIKTEKCPVKTPTLQTPTNQTQTLTEAKVEADDYGFYPSSLEFTKGAKVKLYIYVKSNNVYYGGLDFRSEKFKTEPIKPGQKTEFEFIADKDFIIESYWPLSNVKKAELKVVVK